MKNFKWIVILLPFALLCGWQMSIVQICDGHYPLRVELKSESKQAITHAAYRLEAQRSFLDFAIRHPDNHEVVGSLESTTLDPANCLEAFVPFSCHVNFRGTETSREQYQVLIVEVTLADGSTSRRMVEIPDRAATRAMTIDFSSDPPHSP